MNLSHRARLWVFVCLIGAASTVAAQTTPSPTAPPPIAHVSALDGAASLDRDGITDALTPGWPLLSGDRIRTDSGRVEVLFTDGSALHIDQATSADILAADLLRLLSGRIYLYAAGMRDPSRAVRYQIDAPAASVQTNWPGQYRLSAYDGRLELAVVSGEAVLATDAGSVTVRAGEQAFANDGQRPSVPSYFNSARWDTFDRWSASRRDERVGTVSGQYLPADLQTYSGTFDRYGTWRDEPSVGYVWYPSVAVDWRPYYNGYWRPYESWGSVWIGQDPWGWPTHHYGRWGFSLSAGWYWMPDRYWGPGWVSWVSAPGYVSWCPLGRHGGPVFAHWGLRGSYYGDIDPWRGWTVLPRHAYGRPLSVGRYAVDGRHLESNIRGAFVAHREPPRVDVAVPRAGAGFGASARLRNGRPGGPGGGYGAPGTTGGSAASRGLGPTNAGPADTASRRFPRNDGAGLAETGRSNGDIAASRRFVPGAASPSSGSSFPDRAESSFRATPRAVQSGQSPREAIGGGESTAPMDRATRRFPGESSGASGMPGTSRRFPTGGDTGDNGSSGASGMPGASRRFPAGGDSGGGGSAGASGMPGASRRFPADGGTSYGGSSGASGLPGSSGNPASRRSVPGGSSYEPRSYDAPRSRSGGSGYQPRSNDIPRSYQSPRSYEAPGSSAPSRSYSAPRVYESPRSAPRSYEVPRSSESPRSAPRSYEAPRSYDAPRSAPRSYESPRSSDSNRSSGSAPRYNSGAGSRRDSAPSSSGSRRRSPRE
jgi:hypothetical protein